jgi:hypothetical protein
VFNADSGLGVRPHVNGLKMASSRTNPAVQLELRDRADEQMRRRFIIGVEMSYSNGRIRACRSLVVQPDSQTGHSDYVEAIQWRS